LKIDNLGINGRNLELLFPLLLVAYSFSMDVFNELLKYGKDIMEEKTEEELNISVDASLYEFVASRPSNLQYLAIKEIVRDFRTWHGDEEWLNEKWMGRALKRLNLIYGSRRVASGRMIILNIPKAIDKAKMFHKEVENG